MLTLADLDYVLPEARVAQHPPAQRDDARLLTVDRARDAIADRRFPELVDFLQSGDVLVLNDTKVLPARLVGHKPATGARIELLLLEERAPNEWDVLVRPGRRVSAGTRLEFGDGPARLAGEVLGDAEGAVRRVRFHCEGEVGRLLEHLGTPPLPPYIKRPTPDPLDRDRYQTVYARHPGAVAAPTAGLHFTAALLAEIRHRGVAIAPVTLHVGHGTFQPLADAHLQADRLHAERYELSAPTAATLNACRRAGGRIVAVGTTSARVLETVHAPDGAEPFTASTGRTDLFIRAGYRFRAVDALLTNFHLPRSSLFALVCAFAGGALMRRAYAHAIAARYRFYSYGDATFLF